jgi:hypothetical protein
MTATATQAWRESYLLWASGTTLTQTSWILWGEMGEDLGYMDSQAKRILFWEYSQKLVRIWKDMGLWKIH